MSVCPGSTARTFRVWRQISIPPTVKSRGKNAKASTTTSGVLCGATAPHFGTRRDRTGGRRSPADHRRPAAIAVVNESLRVYPPVWVIPRDAIDDDEIGGFRIPAGS